ncbi:50S ribosomal protein L25/general stress protein Ctc [Candidatus Palauibacter polyketidifaciens]|uniref:50S ribosomal protein L25/general stress protein Ctc n=1 Tax=Candidatus Palauibacter polyketidifaciens TaxID=3056740 RepID=UPI00139BE28D|nr:50S ribosomal protein L25/general stress protein Ctc [Candidatus Palauibacter polyketidifaciens]MDE2720402.1 50S ribosomal protein L25/general stress protein Ctc [Candidatus Palauibacter polyketidifaciens]MYE34990.1 50S ribosomal protein L25/general stress protein Ctc [Gemmatimonadales bacterium]
MTNESVRLTARARTTSGKGAARQLRRSGELPAVVYGRRDETESLALDTHELTRLLSRIHAATTVIDLEIDGSKPRPVLIREIQRHPYRPQLLHVDFFEIRADVKIRVQVPVHLVETPAGVEMGGMLQFLRHELEVECLPNEIPSGFEVDVSALEIGDSLHVSDVDAGGVAILEDEAVTICTVVPPALEEEEEVDEELDEEVEGEGEEAEAAGDEPEED